MELCRWCRGRMWFVAAFCILSCTLCLFIHIKMWSSLDKNAAETYNGGSSHFLKSNRIYFWMSSVELTVLPGTQDTTLVTRKAIVSFALGLNVRQEEALLEQLITGSYCPERLWSLCPWEVALPCLNKTLIWSQHWYHYEQETETLCGLFPP